ncbi:MAG: Crp/Fnr family transcriptional regulator [Clostridiales bacterium]|jgi:CRP-like cAMP-binding protein|nr:Crp/Fnr family transcriptional regulator [Clostridiales bacterium]
MTQSDQNKAVALLLQTKLFESADAAVLKSGIESAGELSTFVRGETIFSNDSYKPAIGLLLSGKARVTKGRTVISTLEKGSLFGAVTLFSTSKRYATEISAVSLCKVLFLPRTLISRLMQENSTIAENYIAYLSQRIYFLTDKIDAFTAGSAEMRLAGWLLSNSKSDGDGVRANVSNLSLLARELDIGRASLYRAFDFFIEEEIIDRDDKTITITDLKKLSSFKK